jgi:hypothetical protein
MNIFQKKQLSLQTRSAIPGRFRTIFPEESPTSFNDWIMYLVKNQNLSFKVGLELEKKELTRINLTK